MEKHTLLTRLDQGLALSLNHLVVGSGIWMDIGFEEESEVVW